MAGFSAIAFGLSQINSISYELASTENDWRNLYTLHYLSQGIGLLLIGIALITAMPALRARFDSLAPTLAIAGAFLAAIGTSIYTVYTHSLGTSTFWEWLAFIPMFIGFLLLGASGFVAAKVRKS